MLIVQICDFGDDGDARYRIHEPSRFLGKIDGVTVVDCHFSHRDLPELAERADVLVAQFVNDWELLSLCDRRRSLGKITIFEANDDFFDLQPWSPTAASWQDRGVQELYRQWLALADGVQTSTNALASQWRRKKARQVAVFPNYLAEIAPLPDRPDRPLTIGWGGSPGHFADWFDVAPHLDRWLNDHPEIHLSVMTNDLARSFLDLSPDRYHFTPFGSLDAYLRFLRSLDIGLAPLLPSAYNRGRSDVKFLEYASQGVVGLYADLDPYRESVIPGETGLLYRDSAELIAALERLRTDLSLRDRIRLQAYQATTRDRRLSDHVGNRLDWYRSLMKGSSPSGSLPATISQATERESGYLRLIPQKPEVDLRQAIKVANPRESAQGLGRIVEEHPRYLAAIQSHAQRLNDARDPLAALAVLDRASALNPFSPRTLIEIARAWFRLDDHEKTRDVLEAAIRANPRSLPAWQSLIRFVRLVPTSDSATWLERAEIAFPDCYPLILSGIAAVPADRAVLVIHRLLGRVAPSLTIRERPLALSMFREAISTTIPAISTTPEVVSLLRFSCQVFPESARLANALAMALRRSGQLEEAYNQDARALSIRRQAAVERQEYPEAEPLSYPGQFAEHIVKVRKPEAPQGLRDQAYRHYQDGRPDLAEPICRRILAIDPKYADVAYLLGLIAIDSNQSDQALIWLDRAATLAPENGLYRNALGELHLAQGDPARAISCFQRAIEVSPTYARAHNNLGLRLHVEGDLMAAESCFREAIRLRPDYATAHNNLGAELQAKEDFASAKAHFEKAIAIRPDYAEAHFNLGTTLQSRSDPAAAALRFQEAIRLRPTYARAHFHLGQTFELLRRDHDAVACFEAAIRLQPDDAESHRRLGNLLVLKKDWPQAFAALERAVELRPLDPEPFAGLCQARQQVCDWRTYDEDRKRLWADAQQEIRAGKSTSVLPFQALSLPWPRSRLLSIARSHSEAWARHQEKVGNSLKPLEFKKKTANSRLRVGYLSGDFHDHPISHLLHGFFGRHDRNSVEVFAYSFGPADQSSYRRRIARESEHFEDVANLSTLDLARRIADDGIQILVDLMGHTGVNRLGVLALRPAPIQVSFLGMLGTMGADFLDYVITDPIVTTPEMAGDFTEQFVTLPTCYLISEPLAELPVRPPGRSELGLPAEGFVYCNFNSAYKMEPVIFDVWMRILARVPGSVLWLCSPGDVVEGNLRREAESRGVEPERLIFAPFVPRPDHILRHRAADLFLDTFLYNAAATASLSLQLGVPMLTCPGDTFASRVGASLVSAVGLPELIATNRAHYEEIAVDLATRPETLQRLRNRLDLARTSSPLFDTPRFVRHLERAYEQIWERFESSQPTRPIQVIDDGREIATDAPLIFGERDECRLVGSGSSQR